MPSKRKNLVLPDVSRYFLISSVVIVSILLLWVVSPFFDVIVYAALITVIFSPIYRFFLKVFFKRESSAAALSTVIVLMIFLIPLTLFIIFIGQEAVSAYEMIEAKAIQFDFSNFDLAHFSKYPVVGSYLLELDQKYNLSRILKNLNVDIVGIVKDTVQSVSSFLVGQSATVVRGLGDSVIQLILILTTIFYFFRDGTRIKNYIKNLSPLPAKYENEIELKLKTTVYGIVVGGFGSSIVQGIIGAIGLQIVGVQYVAFWGTMMAFASLVPYIGASIIWIPICIGLAINGSINNAIFLFIWGFVLVSTVDNFVKPFMIGKEANMHPLATFLVVLGGLFVFGLKGIIFGPLILSLALTIFHIYRLEYRDVLKS